MAKYKVFSLLHFSCKPTKTPAQKASPAPHVATNLSFGIINGTYNLTIFSGTYATNSTLYDIGALSFYNYTFFLLPGESINVDIYDEKNDTPLSWRNVTLEFINTNRAFNVTTQNSSQFVSGLDIGEWQINYFADDYEARSYFVNIENGSYESVRLYLLNDTLATTFEVEVLDENDIPVEGFLVSLLRYFINSNSYDIVEMGKTNTEGKTPLWVEQFNADYQFVIRDNVTGSIFYTSIGQKLTSGSIRININTGDPTLSSFWATVDTDTTLTFSNTTNSFYYTFASLSNVVIEGCLDVTRRTGTVSELICNNCNSKEGGE